jgi:hypothetical protein
MKYKYIQEPKKDCKFYDEEKHHCKGLKELYCAIDEKPCSFYKSKKEGSEED